MQQPWTKDAALNRYRTNSDLQAVVTLEPRVRPLLESAAARLNGPGYNRIREYDRLKTAAMHLVGDGSENPHLKTHKAYDLVVRAIDDLLPPDDVDLFPEGKPKEEEAD
jgi:hypothetical protein